MLLDGESGGGAAATKPLASAKCSKADGNGGFEARLAELVLEYAQAGDVVVPLDGRLSLRADLGIESLSLVSLVGVELGADVTDGGVDLQGLRTIADLFALARALGEARG